MNHYSQQPVQFQGGQQNYLNQNRTYEPTGNVQSHYQGQLSQPTFGQQSASIVGPTSMGYASANTQQYSSMHQHAAPAYHATSQPAVSNNSFMSHQPVHSYASQPATAFGNVGPVIAHVGYQAGADKSHSHYGQQSFYQPAMTSQAVAQHSTMHPSAYPSSSNVAAQAYGMTQTHSNTPVHPVYQATHAYEHAGPVISQVGWQSSSGQGNYSGQMR